MTDYPRWFCPTYLCSYSTTYSHNIKKHLVEVHNYSEDRAKQEVDLFFQAHKEGLDRINSKDPSDPTNPNTWGRGSLAVSREGSLEPDRFFNRGGGGG